MQILHKLRAIWNIGCITNAHEVAKAEEIIWKYSFYADVRTFLLLVMHAILNLIILPIEKDKPIAFCA